MSAAKKPATKAKSASSKAAPKKPAAKTAAPKKAPKVAAIKHPRIAGAPSHWLVKSEPDVYSYAQLEKDKRTVWDGVRNFEARNNMREMREGDQLLFYHSNEGKEVVAIAVVLKGAYQDPSTEEDWSVVEVGPVKSLPKPVSLDTIRDHKLLGQMEMMRRNRLSVTFVTPEEYACVLELGGASTHNARKK